MNPKILYQGQLGTSSTTLFTVGAGKRVTLTYIQATNTNTAERTFNLNIVTSGSASDANLFGSKANKLVGTTNSEGSGYWEWDGAIPLSATESFRGIASAATSITVLVVGIEESV